MNRRTFLHFFSRAALVGLGLAGCARTNKRAEPVTVDEDSDPPREIVDVIATSPASPFDTHTVTIPAAQLTSPPSAGFTVASVPPGHTVTLSRAQLETIAEGGAVTQRTDPDATGHDHDFTFQLA